MISRIRLLVAAVLMGFVAVSLFRYFAGEPSGRGVFHVVAMILLWVPLKGALLRFLGGARPYWSALAANASSELSGLGFPLSGLGLPWPALTASLAISTVVEWLVLVTMRTGRPKACFGMALYANIFVHVLVAGLILWADRRLAGGAVILASFLVFILPIFVVRRSV